MMDTGNIIHIEARGNNSLIFHHNGLCMKSDENIDFLEEETSGVFFFRTHPGHLVNLNFMSKIHLGSNPSVEMSDGTILPLQMKKQSDLIKYFEKFSQ